MKHLIVLTTHFLKVRYFILPYSILSTNIPLLYIFILICSIKKIFRAWNKFNPHLISRKTIWFFKIICLGKYIKNLYFSYIAFLINLLYNNQYLIFKNSPFIIAITLLSLLSLLLFMENRLLGKELHYSLFN